MSKNLFMAETPQVGAEAQLNEGMSVVPSNNGGRIHRLGYIEIIEDDTEKVEVDTEGMTPEELDALRIWEIEKAADEGRLLIHEFTITEEEAKRLGISFCDPSQTRVWGALDPHLVRTRRIRDIPVSITTNYLNINQL